MNQEQPMTIPDEAIEAAHKAWRAQAKLPGTIFEYNLRAAIEAAAPIIAAQAWDEGAAWTNDAGTYTHDDNPYRA